MRRRVRPAGFAMLMVSSSALCDNSSVGPQSTFADIVLGILELLRYVIEISPFVQQSLMTSTWI